MQRIITAGEFEAGGNLSKKMYGEDGFRPGESSDLGQELGVEESQP